MGRCAKISGTPSTTITRKYTITTKVLGTILVIRIFQ
jgi:hypothetical protein